MSKLSIVLVLYYPEKPEVFVSLAAGLPAYQLVIVDNTPAADLADLFSESANVRYVRFGENRGLAAAQNRGMEEAKALGAERVLLFDQDSQITSELVRGLFEAHVRLKARDASAFILGPVLVDALGDGRIQRGFDGVTEAFISRDLIASSGSVFCLHDVERVGPLWEKLFIADVDYEWIWRARTHGMTSYQTPLIRLQHSIGRRSVYFFGRKLGLSEPERYYYQVRNWFLLLRRPYVPFVWRIKELRNLFFAVTYLIMSGPCRRQIMGCVARGLVDGILGR